MAATTAEKSRAIVGPFMNAIVDEKLDEARSLLHDEVYWRNSALFGRDCLGGVLVLVEPVGGIHRSRPVA
jgi:hypothetical protein